jgi:4-aminobutyrate aminotransferase-like enzyme
MTNTEILARRDRLLGAKMTTFYRDPVHIVRGDGAWLFDADGKRYVDMYNNVPCVGHAHPRVVEAMREQMATLNVHSRYLHEGVLDYAERLMDRLTETITTVVFSCSGTEANDAAMHMARIATGGHGFICTDSAYHGNSMEVRKLTNVRTPRDPEIRSIPFPQMYRPLREGASSAELTELYLAKVHEAIDNFRARDIPLAGMLVCPILANEGLPNIPDGFMAGAAAMIREAGGLFIADEVQSGFCRTGQWWGYEAEGFVPDIVTMGKPMGNGVPLSATAARKELVDAFRDKTHYFNTFASCPLQAAVGMAVLEVIEDENLMQNAAETGEYLFKELVKFQDRCESLADVRARGLFISLEWVSDRAAKTPDHDGAVDMVNRLKDKGFLVSTDGFLDNLIKIRPPLVFQREHADLFLSAFEETLDERNVAT